MGCVSSKTLDKQRMLGSLLPLSSPCASLIMKKRLFKLTLKILSNCYSVVLRAGPSDPEIPALSTSTSILPCLLLTSSSSLCRSAFTPESQTTKCTSSPLSLSAAALRFLSFLEFTYTVPPSLASRVAMPRPMPFDDPVTTHILPLNL